MYRTLPLFLAALLFLAVPHPAHAQQPATGTVTGRVTDADTGDPLPGVNVALEGTQRGGATGADGRFRLTGVEAGDYTLTASFLGYAAQQRDISVEGGQTTTADLALAVDGEPVRVESYTDLVTVELPSVRTAVRLFRRHGDRAGDVPGLLAAAGLTVEVAVDGTPVVRAGADAEAGPLERRLGYRSVRLRPLGCLLATLRSPL